MIVVLGGTGFIGSHTALALAAAGEEVVATQRQHHAAPPVLREAVMSGAVRIAPVDIADPAALRTLITKECPSSVIDLSGYAPKALAPEDDVRARVAALSSVLETVHSCGVPRLTVISSMDVYWCLPATEIPYREDVRVVLQEEQDNFITQAWAKKVLEIVSAMFARHYGTDILTLRLGGVYGPGYGTYLSLVSRLVRGAVTGEALDYSQARGGVPVAEAGYDLTFVKDIAAGVATVHLTEARRHRIYNIGAGHAVTHGAVNTAVEQAVPGFVGRTRSRPDVVERRPNAWMSIDRVSGEFGWKPQYSLDEGVVEYVHWLRDNPAQVL